MKRIVFLLSIILSIKSFSQHYNPTMVNATFLNANEEHYRFMWFSADNKTIYANDKTISIFDINGSTAKVLKPNGGSLYTADASNDGSFWIQGNYKENKDKDPNYGYVIPQLETCDLKTGKFQVQSTDKKFISRVILSNQSNMAYGHSSLDGDEEIVQFQINPYKVTKELTTESNYILAYDVFEANNLLVYSTTGDSKALKFVDMSSGKVTSTILKGKEISQIRISSDGKTVFAAAYNILYKIDVSSKSATEINVDKGDGMFILSMDVHPNNRSVVVSSKFGTSLIDAETGDVAKIDKGQSMGSFFSPNGQYLVVSIKSWAMKTTCLALYKDDRFANSNYASNDQPVTEDTIVEETKIEPKGFVYESSEPNFSVICHAEPTETRKKSKKDRLTVSMKSTTKDLAGTITATELPSSIKEEKYPGLTKSIAEKFVEKKEYEIIEKETIEIEGAEGVRYLLKLNNLFYEYWGVTTKGYSYQLVFIYDQKVKDLTPKNNFFNSFKIK